MYHTGIYILLQTTSEFWWNGLILRIWYSCIKRKKLKCYSQKHCHFSIWPNNHTIGNILWADKGYIFQLQEQSEIVTCLVETNNTHPTFKSHTKQYTFKSFFILTIVFHELFKDWLTFKIGGGWQTATK